MVLTLHTIPKKRLKGIPRELRFAHEYCFFLHDQSVRLLAEYEGRTAHFVEIKFKQKNDSGLFEHLANEADPISALREMGYEQEARRIAINQITMGMVSDCLQHIYEGLQCFEKRKIAVALNLLRKPLTDNLLYLSWMLGNEEDFYRAFIEKSPKGIASSVLKGRRKEILAEAILETKVHEIFSSEMLEKTLFDRKNPYGFQLVFQHAVHLITAKHLELTTEAQSFNFIFNDYREDDIYKGIYYHLPQIMLFLSHVIFELFARMHAPDTAARKAFEWRSFLGLYLVEGAEDQAIERLTYLTKYHCPKCEARFKITPYTAARITLTESYRCPSCRKVSSFPFSWLV